jgi:hypothetical protein
VRALSVFRLEYRHVCNSSACQLTAWRVACRYISSRAVRNKLDEVCAASVVVLVPLLAEDADLGQTCRMNAAYTAVSLARGHVCWASSHPQPAAALEAALERASHDDDRYCMAAAIEGLKWLQLGSLADAGLGGSSAAARMVQRMVLERWCPINSVRAPF